MMMKKEAYSGVPRSDGEDLLRDDVTRIHGSVFVPRIVKASSQLAFRERELEFLKRVVEEGDRAARDREYECD